MGSLDYIQGMGTKAIYITGSPFLNFPWAGDGYGPLDFTVLDHHAGDIEDWRDFITEVHARGMYVIMDNTVSTMTDLIGFQGLMNATYPAVRTWIALPLLLLTFGSLSTGMSMIMSGSLSEDITTSHQAMRGTILANILACGDKTASHWLRNILIKRKAAA